MYCYEEPMHEELRTVQQRGDAATKPYPSYASSLDDDDVSSDDEPVISRKKSRNKTDPCLVPGESRGYVSFFAIQNTFCEYKNQKATLYVL